MYQCAISMHSGASFKSYNIKSTSNEKEKKERKTKKKPSTELKTCPSKRRKDSHSMFCLARQLCEDTKATSYHRQAGRLGIQSSLLSTAHPSILQTRQNDDSIVTERVGEERGRGRGRHRKFLPVEKFLDGRQKKDRKRDEKNRMKSKMPRIEKLRYKSEEVGIS
jgi:hypothetical protein